MEDRKMISVSSSDGWQSNRQLLQLCQGNIVCKEIWNPSIKDELKCQWYRANIDDRYPVLITVEYLPKNRAKNDLFSWNNVLFSAEHFRYAPRFLLHFTSGLWACAAVPSSPLCWLALWQLSRRYEDRQTRKILLNQHTRSCYSWTFHVCKWLKVHFC